MIMIFISVILMTCSTLLFSYSFRINGINRLIINAPLTIFETSVPSYLEELYFNKNQIKESYSNYLNKSIKNYCNSYEIYYRFFYPNDNSTCEDYCQGVEISVEADIFLFYKYNRTMFYLITES